MNNRLSRELSAQGCKLDVDAFRAVLLEELGDTTTDDLLCHPHEALAFCDRVRRRLDCALSTTLILKTLLNLRKNRHLRLALGEPGVRVTPKPGTLRLPDAYFPLVEPSGR
ncbi:MAG TPA: hypothetical protein PKD86_00820 [Gemmatales bacterium]|nr:hypothetical protein [Gemmatales bacterium]